MDKVAYIGIDLEFSGIKSDFPCSFTDMPNEHYLKRREVVNKYNII